MTLEEIQAVLARARAVRLDLIDPNMRPQERIALMEDYMWNSASYRGELEEALDWCVELGKALRKEWDAIEGWESALPARADYTEPQMNAAKRKIRPALWDAMQEAKALCDRIGRQIRRLEIDKDTLSRVYSLMSGGK